MSDKHADEVDLVRRLLNALRYKDFALTPGDRPDVLVETERRRIGVEVTVFHADEIENRKGSVLRAIEEGVTRKAAGDPYSEWGVINPMPGLSARIADKISVATAYSKDQFDELWLLIVGQLPKPGAVASTFVVPIFLNLEGLNQHFDEMLHGAPFGKVYLHLCLDQVLYGWSPSGKWQLIYGSRPSSIGSTPSLKEILDDPEWQRDPRGKALSEAHKAMDELVEQRSRGNVNRKM